MEFLGVLAYVGMFLIYFAMLNLQGRTRRLERKVARLEGQKEDG